MLTRTQLLFLKSKTFNLLFLKNKSIYYYISDPTNPIGVDYLRNGEADAKLFGAATIYVKGNYVNAQFGNYVDIRGGLSVSASTNIQGSLSVAKEFIDSNGDGGDAGQVLSAIKTGTGTSTITGTKWISKNVTNLRGSALRIQMNPHFIYNTFTITADKTAIVIQTDGINQWYILSNY